MMRPDELQAAWIASIFAAIAGLGLVIMGISDLIDYFRHSRGGKK